MKPKQLFKARSFSLKTLNEDYVIPIGKVYCVGRNFSDHAVEMNESIEKIEPFFFTKPPQSLTQNNKIPFPQNTNNLHHEVELVVLIGSECKQVQPSDVEKMILGYAVGLDLTKRDLQENSKRKSDNLYARLCPWYSFSFAISLFQQTIRIVQKNRKIPNTVFDSSGSSNNQLFLLHSLS